MIDREYVSRSFRDTAEQEAQVRLWQSRYMALVGSLAALGTEVRVERVREHDQDIPPYNFIRHALHEFVFPQQGVTLREDKSGYIDPTPGYLLYQDDRACDYDESVVRGHIGIHYDDADSRITFSVVDLHGESELHPEVLAAIEENFEEEQSSLALPTQAETEATTHSVIAETVGPSGADSTSQSERLKLTPLEFRRIAYEHLEGTNMLELLTQVELKTDDTGHIEDFVADNLRKMFRVAARMTPDAEAGGKFKNMLSILGEPTPET